ncbi:glycogen debranching N-terminal domain-containing protein [Solwaraspora sp. WMMD1047]|uniref:amylo-alpha-1,6-glucosidase n=1 Tax=Solwaraspora sp. WMMD1047 TaxID=3016102 RepID=UPI00241753CD|nr:glycogen debranching N-terminal domain-containing protein [Solwaraspora sp. WMMD1047]MDG4830696.1 glycogen debranching N-terminal domain-containing protein [Solwaraspora sp. WMMD1047]
MTDEVDRFLETLGETSPGRLPPPLRGSLRLELVRPGGNSHWLATFAGGRATAVREPGPQTGPPADCTVCVSAQAFDRLLAGEDQVIAMLFRNCVAVEGDLSFFLHLRRLLPPLPESRFQAPPIRTPRRSEHHRTASPPMTPVSIFHGNLFMISDRAGDIESAPASPLGLFFYDTRFLSTWRLRVNGERVQPLSVDDLQFFEARFFLTPGEPTHYVDSSLSIFRHRWAGDALQENLTIINHANEATELSVRLDVDADFAEVLEIKANLPRERTTTVSIADRVLRLRYQRKAFVRETVISANVPAAVDERGMTFTVRIEAHGAWSAELRVDPLAPRASSGDIRKMLRSYQVRTRSQIDEELRTWVSGAPSLRTDHEPLDRAYRRGLVDLAALEYRGLNLEQSLPAAGMPWFMTLFGRDGLISSLQALPFLPERSIPTLRVLALAQGARWDPFRGEEPGKMLQEVRYSESVAFNELPHAADFSAADTTPLFIVLLDEYERWTGDSTVARDMEFEARAALDWIDGADLRGDGYLWYEARPTGEGPVSQSWKGSPEAISFHDGRLASYPQASCEIQGYVYDAKRRAARLARRVWNDPGYADRLDREATELRERFNRDFWIADRGYYALALQGDGEQVDALASNMGHLLWSGIVDPDRAGAVVERLLGPALFSGWGIRTLATTESRYNPVGYHTGTVWPCDNSIIAWGLRRYGFNAESGRIAHAIIDAARYFDGRLPEAFAGYERTLTKYPVLYSSASIPHATSAGTPLLLLRTMLGLEPVDERLIVDPAVPPGLGQIELHDIPGRWGLLDALGRATPDPDRG